MFRVAPSLEMKKLEAISRHKVFKMLLARGRITKAQRNSEDTLLITMTTFPPTSIPEIEKSRSKGMRRPFGNPAIGSPPTGRGL
jgi:hypothetical protein